MKLSIGNDPQTVHTAQLVYFNRQELCSDSLYWLNQKLAKQTGKITTLKIVAASIICNAYMQKN